MPARLNPPFRADHVGSLLRAPQVLAAREEVAAGEMTPAQLRQVEDEAIAAMIPRLEDTGLVSITDGEYRRAWFHLDFLQQLDGVAVTGTIASSSGSKDTVGMSPPKVTVTGRLSHTHHIQVADYEFLRKQTAQVPKVCIPSPTMAHFRGGRAGIDIESYPDLDEFFEDLAQCYREEIASLYEAGCRYIQLDDTNLAYLCDPMMREGVVERGDDPDELPRTYAALINAAIRDVPDDMTTAVHLCRGNYKSTFFASGGYEAVAEVLFTELDVDAFFLEYDDERSGDFAPLRFVPADKTVVLGLITSKTPRLETETELLARIEEASRYVDMAQLCLSPQCGFASTMEGNRLTEDEQWAKLRLVVSTAEKAWGSVTAA